MEKKVEAAATEAVVRADAKVAAMEAKRAAIVISVASLPIESIYKQGARIWAEMLGPDAVGCAAPVVFHRRAPPHRSCVGCIGVTPPGRN
jgi:hypothetical protein